ncbi:RHS repeat domain-containing protein [Nocardioides terrisoli]|uniref:hypothetical protein n=1 Tax=Nocardioides terrisoli TaxID=3388267 RepID=UPI00287BC579|nr:hypothetical protein [Nocardioides marmorisolisilvae]
MAPASATPDPYAALTLSPAELRGAVVTTTTDVKAMDGRVQRATVTTVYDTSGHVVSQSRVITDAAGTVTERSDRHSEYDARGQLIDTVSTFDSDGDGPGPTSTAVDTPNYDRQGHLTSEQQTVDDNGDGVIDRTNTFAFGNDRRGRALTTTYDYSNSNESGSGYVLTTTYDQRGNVLEWDTVQHDEHGAVLLHDVVKLAYDSRGQLIRQTQSQAQGPGALTLMQDEQQTYDPRGQLTLLNARIDDDGDGVYDRQIDVRNDYGQAGRLLRSVTTSTDPASGRTTNLEAVTYGYDNRGRQVSTLAEFDTDGDGVPEATQRLISKYDSQGRLEHTTGDTHDADGQLVDNQFYAYTYDTKGRISLESWTDTASGSTTTATTRYDYIGRSTVTYTSDVDYGDDGVIDDSVTVTRTLS